MPSTSFLGDNEYVVIESDRNATGVGDIIFRSGGVERARIAANGAGLGFAGGSLSDYLIKKIGSTWYANSISGVGASYQGSVPETVMQNAINALRGIGGLLELRDNPTFTTVGVTLYPGMKLRGQGMLGVSSPVAGTSYIQATGFNTPVVTLALDAGNTGWASFPILEGFAILGDTSKSGMDGILVSDVNGALLDVFINQIGVFNVGGNGLNISDSTGKVFVLGASYFEHCQLNGIRNQNAELIVMGGYIFSNVLFGIDATSGAYTAVSNADISNNGQTGTANAAGAIKCGSNGTGGLIQGCKFADNGVPTTGQAIRITTQTSTGRWAFGPNSFKDSRGASAVTNFILTSDSGATNALISDNTFVGQQGDAVKVKFNNASENVQIRSNLGFNPYGKVTNPVNTTNNSIGLAGLATTATGVNALNSATINCGSTTGFPASGNALLAGVAFTYTGVSGGNSFTGCGVHAATVGGEAIIPCPVASTDYVIREVDQFVVVAGGTAVSIAIKDNLGNTIQSGLTTLAQLLPLGWKINLGAFTGTPPTVASYGN